MHVPEDAIKAAEKGIEQLLAAEDAYQKRLKERWDTGSEASSSGGASSGNSGGAKF